MGTVRLEDPPCCEDSVSDKQELAKDRKAGKGMHQIGYQLRQKPRILHQNRLHPVHRPTMYPNVCQILPKVSDWIADRGLDVLWLSFGFAASCD